MNKVVYIFLSLVVTFKSFPVLVLFHILDKNGYDFIVNKCTKDGYTRCVNLDEVELKNINNVVKDDDTLTSWCREFSINHIGSLDKKKLKEVFNDYANASTVEFLQDVFNAYEVEICIADKKHNPKQIDDHNSFLEYIGSSDLRLKYPYLYIGFCEDSVTTADVLINKNAQLIKTAIDGGNVINKKIEAICKNYLKNVEALDVTKKVNYDFDKELSKEIDSYFFNKNLNPNNLTGVSFVNDLLKKEIERIKIDCVKECNKLIDIKVNKFNKMKAEAEKKKKIKKEIGSEAPATTTISTTNKFKDNANANISSTAPKTSSNIIDPKTNISKIIDHKTSSKINDNKTISKITSTKIISPKTNITKINIPGEINTNINNTDTATTNHKNKTTTSTGAKPTTSTVADNINKTEVDNDLIKGSETSDGSTTTSKFGGGCCSSCRNNGN